MFLLWGQACRLTTAVCIFYQLADPARVNLPELWCFAQNTLEDPGSGLASRDETWNPEGCRLTQDRALLATNPNDEVPSDHGSETPQELISHSIFDTLNLPWDLGERYHQDKRVIIRRT